MAIKSPMCMWSKSIAAMRQIFSDMSYLSCRLWMCGPPLAGLKDLMGLAQAFALRDKLRIRRCGVELEQIVMAGNDPSSANVRGEFRGIGAVHILDFAVDRQDRDIDPMGTKHFGHAI